ncbi:MAG: hypothetical protein NZM15_05700 [Flavobacteriales bacterium]|nr:hypothetical protein [Flavobacteriales bacterium]MDW8432178.1 hypothetical protein [Flavobacteriales bacterium]
MLPLILFYLTLILCAALAGVFWFMQVAYYPAFRYVSPEKWAAFFKKRYQNTAMVVYPIMAFETLSSLALFFMMLRHRMYAGFSIATFLLLAIWLWNLLVLKRQMDSLSEGADEARLKALEKAGWVRAGGYTLRLLFLIGSLT